MNDIYSHLCLFLNIKELIHFTSTTLYLSQLRNTKAFWKNQYHSNQLPWLETKSNRFIQYIEKFIHAYNVIKVINHLNHYFIYHSINLSEIFERLKMLDIKFNIIDVYNKYDIPRICVNFYHHVTLTIICNINPLITILITREEFEKFIYPDLYDGTFWLNNFYMFNRVHYKNYKKLLGVDLYVF